MRKLKINTSIQESAKIMHKYLDQGYIFKHHTQQHYTILKDKSYEKYYRLIYSSISNEHIAPSTISANR